MSPILIWCSLLIADAVAPQLRPAERDFLDALVRDVVFDPRRAQRVRATWTAIGRCYVDDEFVRVGWLVDDRLHFIDGAPIDVPPTAKIERVDFVADFRRYYGGPKKRDGDKHERALGAEEAFSTIHLVRAAWLHRLGEDALAVRALLRQRDGEKELDVPRVRNDLREALARFAYREAQRSFALLDDDDARFRADHFLRRYADLAAASEDGPFRQVAQIRKQLSLGEARATPRVDQVIS